MLNKKAPCKCLSVIMLDSVIKANEKYYPQTLLEECKYEPWRVMNIKMESLIDDDLEKCLSDQSGSESDNDSNDETESEDEKDNDESNK